MQRDKVYVMDVAGVNKVCNGSFSDSKAFTRVKLIACSASVYDGIMMYIYV